MSAARPTGNTNATAAARVVAPVVSRFCPMVSKPRVAVPKRTHAGKSSAVPFWMVNMRALNTGTPRTVERKMGMVMPPLTNSDGS